METRPKIKLTINGKEVLTDPGLTILDAAKAQGIEIPTLCHHPALSSHGGCRICVVEVDNATRLVASCVTPVREGMHIVTENDRIIQSRRSLLEFLFAERNHHCMFCSQSGDCELQRLAYLLGMDHLSVPQSFKDFPVDFTSSMIGLDHNRCVLCGRCVRACEEISGCHVLNFHNRGPQTLIGFDLSESREKSSCFSCGACLQVCPTGALFNRYRTHVAVKGHPDETSTTTSICPLCGFLCPTVTSSNHFQIVKVEGDLSKTAGRPDHGRLCRKGRFEVLKTAGQRLLHPLVKKNGGSWEKSDWHQALDFMIERMVAVQDENGDHALVGITSSGVSNEELILFKELMQSGFAADRVDTLDGHHFRQMKQVEEKIGKYLLEASWKSIPGADFILMLGWNARDSRTMIPSLVQQTALQNGAKTVQIGLAEHRLPYVTCFIPEEKGKEASLLRAVKNHVAGAGMKALKNRKTKGAANPSPISAPGLHPDSIQDFSDAVKSFANAKAPLIIVGEDYLDSEAQGSLLLVSELALMKGLLSGKRWRLIVEKACGNSAGAWKLGLASRDDMPRHRRWKGGLFLLGGENKIGKPYQQEVRRFDFLAVISPVMLEDLPECAGVLLPKPMWMEEDGSYTSLDGTEVAYKERVIRAPRGMRDTWEVLSALADRIGLDSAYNNWDILKKAATQHIKNKG